jgi:hypothetical protein
MAVIPYSYSVALAVYGDFDLSHLPVSVVIVSSIDEYFIKYLEQSRYIRDALVDNHVCLLIVNPHVFGNGFN